MRHVRTVIPKALLLGQVGGTKEVEYSLTLRVEPLRHSFLVLPKLGGEGKELKTKGIEKGRRKKLEGKGTVLMGLVNRQS